MKRLYDFADSFPLRKFDKGEMIIQQDEELASIYVIREGYVKGYDISSQGSEQLVWLGVPGDIFPIGLLFKTMDRNLLFYSAFTEVEANEVNAKEATNFVQARPDLLVYLGQQMSDRITRFVQRLNAVEKPKADEKIIYTLKYLAERFSEGSKSTATVPVNLTHQDVANFLGLTRETAAVELKKLKDKGYIYYDKQKFLIYRDRINELL